MSLTIFYAAKGGQGTTTTAAAYAAHLSQRGPVTTSRTRHGASVSWSWPTTLCRSK